MSLVLPIADDFSTARLELHWLAQLVAAAANQALDPAEDDSHSNLFVTERGFRGRPLGKLGSVEIEVATLRVHLADESFDLSGRTLAEGMDWLAGKVGGAPSLPGYDLPSRPSEKAFVHHEAMPQVHAWFAAASQLVAEVAAKNDGGEIRLWPHHFDLATLISIDGADQDGEPAGEDARSINVGYSPGDASYDEPYFYVTPWPRPKVELPALEVGHWHTDGFTAAVLPASLLAEPATDTVRKFLQGAATKCRQLLG